MKRTVEDIVSDDEVQRKHYGNWGSTTPREVIAEGVLYAAYGYSTGYTMESIVLAHKLAFKRNPKAPMLLTKKGREYLRAAAPFNKVRAVVIPDGDA